MNARSRFGLVFAATGSLAALTTAQSHPHAGGIPIRPTPRCEATLPLPQFEVTGRPDSVHVGDLDGDGDYDLAVRRDLPAQGFSILKNRGDGTFDVEEAYSVNGARAIALGDLDGDEDLDLAVACPGTTLQLFTNDGQAAFAQGSSLTVGTDANTVVIADLNGDGDSDIVSGNSDPHSISVLLNAGRGRFAPQVQYIHFGAPTSIAIADLDGDGDPDLATTNSSTDTVSVRLNDGDGAF